VTLAGQQLLADIEPLLLPDQLNLAEGEVPVFDERKHKYSRNGTPMPGVTSILGILDKPALPWWGMTIGVQGVAKIYDDRGPDVFENPQQILFEFTEQFGATREECFALTREQAVVKLLTSYKATVNHIKDAAGSRGTAAHDALEAYLKHGKAPDLRKLTPEAKGYLQSGAGFMIEMEPKSVGTEVMVWHPKLGYAGTFDLLAEFDDDGVLTLADYKTSKRIYDTHLLQLAAYEGARRALGLQPVERLAVVHLTPDGEWDRDTHWVEVTGPEIDHTIKDFESIHATYAALERRKARLAQARRDAKAAAKAAKKKEA
jgi:hypothetical protein